MAKHLLLIVGAVLLLSACDLPWKNPSDPSTTVVVTQTVSQNTPTPVPSPSPGAADCGGVTSIVLGTQDDKYKLKAGGTDTVVLVPSFYQNLFELPPLCTDKLKPVFTATGNAGCTVSGLEVRAASPGSCSITAKLPAIPASNAVDLTVTP